MNTSAMLVAMIQNPQAQNAPPTISEDRPFRIVAIYDSAEASRETARAWSLVRRELGEEVPIDRSSWALESLESWTACTSAAVEATRADMIVLALGTDAPPQTLQHWIKSWEKERQIEGGLLALIPTEHSREASALADYLQETAITAQMDFLCRRGPRYKAEID